MGLKALLGMTIVDAAVIASELIDFGYLFNLVTILVAIGVAIPVVKSRRKDAIIRDHEAAERSKDELIGTLRTDLKGAEARANQHEQAVKDMREQVAAANARYEEQSKYTAKAALVQIEKGLTDHREQLAERHERMLEVLEQIVDRLDSLEQTRHDDLHGPDR